MFSHPVSDSEIWTGDIKCVGCRNDLAFALYPSGTHTWCLHEEKSMSRYIVKTSRGFVYNSHVYMFYMYTPVQTERELLRRAFYKMVSKLADKNFNTVVVDYMDDKTLEAMCDIYIRLPDEIVMTQQVPYGSIMAEKMLADYACHIYGSAIITPFPFFTGVFPDYIHIFHMRASNGDTPLFMGEMSYCVDYFKEQVAEMKLGNTLEKITIGVKI
jgi:hypothetical protein